MDAATPLPDFDEVRRAIDAARDVMRTAIEARKKPDIVQIFVRVRHIHAEAAGSETYFEEAKNAESQHKAREVRLGAECLMGQWLADIETAELRYMGRPEKGTKIGTPPDPGLITLDDLGIDRHESQRWQAVAKLTAEEFAALVADNAATSALLRQLPESRSAQGPKIHNISLSSIDSPPYRLRALRQNVVDALAESMRERGLINPITLGPREGLRHGLIAGLHRLVAARKLGWKKITAIVLRGTDAVEAELVEIDENLIRADLTPAEQAAHHARRKKLHEQKHPETISVTKRGGPGRGKKNGRQNGEGLADRYTKDAAEKTGDSERTIQRNVERGNDIPNVAELAGTSLDQGAELDALAKLKDIAPDRQSELIERAKSGEKVSARAEIKKAQQEKRESEQAEQPAPKAEAAPPVASTDPAPPPDLLDAATDRATPDDVHVLDADLPTYFGPSRRQLSLNERLGNLISLTEEAIFHFIPEMRAAGRLPELFHRVRKSIDKLEAEAAADGDQTEDCAPSAAIERATPTQEEMPPSPAVER